VLHQCLVSPCVRRGQVSDTEVALRTSAGDYLTASSAGSSLAPAPPSSGAPGPPSATACGTPPPPRPCGGQPGGWLVAEKWMDPGLFEGVPEVIDGVVFSLRGQGAAGRLA